MKQKERIAMQAILAEEAIAKLMAISRLYGVEEIHDEEQAKADYEIWRTKVEEFRDWVWHESPIA